MPWTATLLLLGFIGLTSGISAARAQSVPRYLAPAAVQPAQGNYSLGVETAPGRRWVHIAGQTGVRKDGSVPQDFATQTRVAMDNIKAILAAADMHWSDVVSFRVYMTDRSDLSVWRTLSGELFGGVRPAGTLVFVDSLIDPAWRIEIEATAAQ